MRRQISRKKVDNVLKWLGIAWVALTIAVLAISLMNAQPESSGNAIPGPENSFPLAILTLR
jgi:hypothetical protein